MQLRLEGLADGPEQSELVRLHPGEGTMAAVSGSEGQAPETRAGWSCLWRLLPFSLPQLSPGSAANPPRGSWAALRMSACPRASLPPLISLSLHLVLLPGPFFMLETRGESGSL